MAKKNQQSRFGSAITVLEKLTSKPALLDKESYADLDRYTTVAITLVSLISKVITKRIRARDKEACTPERKQWLDKAEQWAREKFGDRCWVVREQNHIRLGFGRRALKDVTIYHHQDGPYVGYWRQASDGPLEVIYGESRDFRDGRLFEKLAQDVRRWPAASDEWEAVG